MTGRRPLSGPKFPYFQSVFGNNWSNNRLPPLRRRVAKTEGGGDAGGRCVALSNCDLLQM